MRTTVSVLALLTVFALGAAAADPAADGWVELFDGKTLDGWKANENPSSCRVEDGAIVVNGERSHLFYVGPVKDHDFTDFELRAEVMTRKGANSGIYFHTKWQDSGWPGQGYESQVNNTQGDPKKTGGLYNVQDVFEAPAKDDVWFVYEISVKGKRIVVKIDGKVTVDYTEPADLKRPERQLSHGTFALQAHDPGSKVLFRSIKVKAP